MALTIAVGGSTTLLLELGVPAIRATVLAGAAGLGLTVLRVKSASLRLFSWTAVLYAALAMPLLGWILPPLPAPLPTLLQQDTDRVLQDSRASSAGVSAARETPMPAHGPQLQQGDVESSPAHIPARITSQRTDLVRRHFGASLPWILVVTWTYFSVASALLMRFVVGVVVAERLVQRALKITAEPSRLRLASCAQTLGMSFVPAIAESQFISVPMTMGVLRPTILLPTNWSEWDEAKLDAVVAHEMSHISRRDALTQRLALVHRAIFWFSPLAWWLNRHLADLAEQASDEAVLSCGADCSHYARTLLGFFEALQAAPGRVWWEGVAVTKAGQAEQRLERILGWKGAVTVRLKKSIAVMIAIIAIPLVYVAATVRAAEYTPGTQEPAAPSAPARPTPAPHAAPGVARVIGVVPPTAPTPGSETSPALAPVPGSEPDPATAPVSVVSVAGVAPVAPATWAHQTHSSSGHGYSYGYDDEQRFVIVSGKTEGFTMSGSSEDARHVEKLRKKISGDFIWFQRDEKSYIIRDQATIERARKLWAPQEEVGKKQEELGKQQEALGKQQEELSAKMEQVKVNVPDMTSALDHLKANLQKLGPSATMEQIGELQSEIGELQSKIGEIQSHAGEQQSKLGEEMGALGEEQGKLGEQQGELGRQKGELAEKAARDMKTILDEAIKNGTAQREPEDGGAEL